ncbi:MAG TPA: hypothetical protein DCY40_04165 [Actinobacteria bacterium]|nr:hypothetical protein [Actinomycetota bacterium]
MTLDDLARDAAARTRQEAADLGRVNPTRYRRGRQLRNGMLFGAAAVVALLVFLVVIAVPPPMEKTAVTVITTPDVPSSTIPSPPTTSPSGPTGVLGAGWEEIDAGPVAGRYGRHGAAVAWSSEGLIIWGGSSSESGAVTQSTIFYRDGYRLDPATGTWHAIPPAGVEGLCGGEVRALTVGDRVLFYGADGPADRCALAAVYHPSSGSWFQVDDEFASRITRDTALVWTGELVVAPEVGVAYHLHSGEPRQIPSLADRLDEVVHSPLRAHWTGFEVLAVGSGPVYAWAPGDDEWRDRGTPPVPHNGRASVWAEGDGLWVVNSDMAVAVLWDNGWNSPGSIPLTFAECVPEAVAVSGTPVVRTCSGLAIWDGSRGTWVPAPLEVPGWGVHSDGVLVAAEDEDAVYSVGPHIYRYRVRRLPGGGIESSQAIPIGRMELDPLDPWVFDSAFVAGSTVGVTLTGPSQCAITSTGGTWTAPAEFLPGTEGGVIHNPGRAILHATIYRSADDAARFGVAIAADPDTVFIRCDGGNDDAVLSEHATTLASRLWWPDEPLVAAPFTDGPGWDALDAGPIEGRMRIAAAWTGEELFVWGGHDGYIQETPGPESFHQDAYLFDPITDTWRPAAPPPDDLCAFTEAGVIPLDEEVLLRGLAPDRDGCSQAAIYTPADNTWRIVDSPLFDVFYFRTDLVWTGDWLAAPRAGLAWVPDTGETVGIPPVPRGLLDARSPTDSHWNGNHIVTIAGGDVYTLLPGDDKWKTISGPALPEGGRVSVWYQDGLLVAESGHLTALLDDQDRWNVSRLPLRDDECRVDLLVAAGHPVASTCSGMAIWDNGSWIPIPVSAYGWSWMPLVVASDGAIYSLGEGFHRYPIEFEDGLVVTPDTIPIGVALVKIGGFRIIGTIGWSNVQYPDGSIGFAIAVALAGPRGLCHVTSTYGGPALGEPAQVRELGLEVLVFDSPNAMTDWAVRTGDSDVVRINCESEDDALTLARSLWIP